jgi:hypothetical protein
LRTSIPIIYNRLYRTDGGGGRSHKADSRRWMPAINCPRSGQPFTELWVVLLYEGLESASL